MIPENGYIGIIPDGYTTELKIPPQLNPKIEKTQKGVSSSMQGLVISNFFISFLLRITVSHLISSINSLQITAHLPLISIPFSAKTYFIFDILIIMVSFDYF